MSDSTGADAPGLGAAARQARTRAHLDRICAENLLAAPGIVTFFFKDLEGRLLRVSQGCADLTGRTPDEMIGLTDFDLTDHDHATELLADERRIIATGEPMIDKQEVDRLANQPGTLVETSKFPLRDDDGTIIGTFGYSRDVTAWAVAERRATRMAAEAEAAHAQLVQVEAQLRDVLEGSTDLISSYDTELRCQYLNPAGLRLLGSVAGGVVGRTAREFGMSETLLAEWEPALRGVLATGQPGTFAFSVQGDGDGTERWFDTVLAATFDANGQVAGVLASSRDVSAARSVERALAHRASHDSLTGLANRALFTERLGEALARRSGPQSRLTVLFVDLDHFKDVNDRYGHAAGDDVLVEVARRLEESTRLSDTVARLGGDEFIILCDRATTDDSAEQVAARIVRELARPMDVGGAPMRLSASVGAVVADGYESSAAALLREADAAMYRSKQAGRNQFRVVRLPGAEHDERDA